MDVEVKKAMVIFDWMLAVRDKEKYSAKGKKLKFIIDTK